MSSLDKAFTIEIDGAPIVKVTDQIRERTQARVADSGINAMFTLKEGRLSSDGYHLGRYTIENRSFMPKEVFWFPKGDGTSQSQAVSAEKSGDSYKLQFGGGSLIAEGGRVFADLQGLGDNKVVIKFVTEA
ncbi:hypothetical protein F5X68DRAFT_210718 [Plectosphaerella plurivora]|uniref:Uncharacterized protein n=1 Tax=Plectosphaerella plurivora TaxID=936078 RepID=A0A9P9A9J1_9PEZI|nr:hypothetical protein F5X68DRAFT_210718 [Plectosphaerella plurivora]